MPKYRVLMKSFINNTIYEEDSVVEYDGDPSDNLELIEDEAPSPKARGKKSVESAVSEGAGEE